MPASSQSAQLQRFKDTVLAHLDAAHNLARWLTRDDFGAEDAVQEACLRAYARKFGEDEEKWGIVGLIHDFDYEKYPSLEDHPYRGNEILTQRGWPEEISS